jgi:hypothetical protein
VAENGWQRPRKLGKAWIALSILTAVVVASSLHLAEIQLAAVTGTVGALVQVAGFAVRSADRALALTAAIDAQWI